MKIVSVGDDKSPGLRKGMDIFVKVVDKIFGTHSERELKRIMPLVDKIEELRPAMQALSDEELKAKRMNTKRDWRKERRWMSCFPRPLPRCGRLQGAF